MATAGREPLRLCWFAHQMTISGVSRHFRTPLLLYKFYRTRGEKDPGLQGTGPSGLARGRSLLVMDPHKGDVSEDAEDDHI
jgi:hypothetical protein